MSPAVETAGQDELKTWLQVNYGLYAAGAFVGFTPIVAVIVAHVKKDEAAGSWLASHFRWQIRTFWYGLLWGVIGLLTAIFIVGFAILIADAVWMLYRVIKGWIYLNDGKPMYAPAAALAPAQ